MKGKKANGQKKQIVSTILAIFDYGETATAMPCRKTRKRPVPNKGSNTSYTRPSGFKGGCYMPACTKESNTSYTRPSGFKESCYMPACTKESNTSYTCSSGFKGGYYMSAGLRPRGLLFRLRSEDRRAREEIRREPGLRPETKEELGVAWLWV